MEKVHLSFCGTVISHPLNKENEATITSNLRHAPNLQGVDKKPKIEIFEAMILNDFKSGEVDVSTEDYAKAMRSYYESFVLPVTVEELTNTGTENEEVGIDKGEKYYVTMRNRKTGETIRVDIYDVLEAFSITCSAMAHALKKLLKAGSRGVKGFDKDCDEAINSVEQSKLLQKYRDADK